MKKKAIQKKRMSSSREDSPDWLRSFQPPTVTLSSDSNLSPNSTTPSLDPSSVTSPSKIRPQGDVRDGQVAEKSTSDIHEAKHSVYTLSSDSEYCPNDSSLKVAEKSQIKESAQDENTILVSSRGRSPLKNAPKGKSPKIRLKVDGSTPKKEKSVDNNLPVQGNHVNLEVPEEGKFEKHSDPSVSSTRFPLVLPEKVQRSKVLVECEGESIDLSGDVGAVGRVVVPDTPSGNSEMYLDLKGTIYKSTIIPSRTFCVVSFGQSEAKIEAMMNDFIQLKPQSNVYEAETMVEGTLEGFSFDSEDETDKIAKAASHQNEDIDEQTVGKTKGNAEKSGAQRKRGKTAGGKLQPAKKIRKKTQAPKKSKTKK